MQTDFVEGNNISSQYFFVTSFGLFVLIADPKVVVVTETINSKNKIKLKWSMVNLKRQCLKRNWRLLKRQFKDRKYKTTYLLFSTLHTYLFLYNLVSLYVESLWAGCFISWMPAVPMRVEFFFHFVAFFSFVFVCI